MVAERKKKGTKSKNHTTWADATTASSPSSPGPNTATAALAAQDVALNPPFDPRMRRMGSPLNLSAQIKRGWIQNVDGTERVNFLFNPSAIDIASQVNPDLTKSPLQAAQSADVLDPFYTSTGPPRACPCSTTGPTSCSQPRRTGNWASPTPTGFGPT